MESLRNQMVFFKILIRPIPAYYIVLTFLFISLGGASRSLSASDDSTSVDTLGFEKSSLSILPIIFYSPQTKLAAGVLPTYIYRSSAESRPSSVTFPAYYTLNKQISISVEPQVYYRNGLYRLSGLLYYQKWPDLFYGLGNATSVDDEEEYTTRSAGGLIDFQRRFGSSLYFGVVGEFSHSELIEIESRGLLSGGDITGAETGTVSGAGVSISWDSRDNIFFPRNGSYHVVSAASYGSVLSGDYFYNGYIIDLRKYAALDSNKIIAVQAYGSFTDGDPPFGWLPRLGGIIRGYYPLRYIDRSLLAFQAEYRMHPVWRRFGIIGFAGIGAVADGLSDFRSDNFKFAAGVGIRYLFIQAEGLNIRFDIGFGEESSEIYFNIGEAF
ncbi:MAG: BamA/TamA family outer membrane protein [candidate division Zixibacteria bacterium]